MLAALSPCCESHAFATLAPDTIVVEKKQDPAAARNNENVVFGKVTDVNGEPLLTSSSCHPKIFVKEFSYFLMPCHQHCLGVNLLVQR